MHWQAVQWRPQWIGGILLGMYAGGITLIPSATGRLLWCVPLVLVPILAWLLGDAQRWLTAFFLAAWLLPPLPFAIGNSGPHVALICAAIGAWIALLDLNQWRIPLDAVTIFLIALYAAICLSLGMALWYSGAEIAAASTVRVLLFGIAVFIYCFVRGKPVSLSAPFIRLLFWTAVLSALFACVDFYFQFPAPAGYGAQFVWLDTGVFRRAQGLFYEASTLGNFCAFFLIMIACAVVTRVRERILPLWAMFGGGIILAAALVLSYSRASLINLLVAGSVLAWLHRAQIRLTRWVPAIAISTAIAGIALFWIFPAFLWAYWARISASAQFFLESPNGVLSGRVQSWTFLSDFLMSHPWHAIMGVGYKTLPYSDFLGTKSVADNTYLSMLIETGIAGLAALIAFNIAVLRACKGAAQSADPWRGFLGAWMLCFWAGESVQMLSGDILTYWRVIPAYFCILALALKQ